MKKIFILFVAVLTLCCLFSCSDNGSSSDTNANHGINTNTDTSSNMNTDTDTTVDTDVDSTSVLKFTLINNKTEYTVSECDKSAVSVVIPSEYEGLPVTKISAWSFSHNKSIESVVIPSSVKAIDGSSFSNCESLKYLEIPNSVEAIGVSAFHGCISLETVKIGAGVNEIGYDAFYYCKGIKEFIVDEANIKYTDVDGCLYSKDEKTIIQYTAGKEAEYYELPHSVEEIGTHAFSYCNLKKVIMNDTVKEIKVEAFAHSNITEAEIPKSVTKIYGGAFYRCMELTKVKISEGVTEIGNSAFFMCYALEEIEIPYGVTKIGSTAFESCKNLKKVILPSTVTEIEKYTFRLAPVEYVEAPCIAIEAFWDEHLKHIKINGGVEIPQRAFKEAPVLETVELCDSVKTVGYQAFMYCYELKSINLESVTKISDQAFWSCHKLNNVTLSSGLTEIGEFAFIECKELERVVISKSVTMIKRGAFGGCARLSIYCNGDEMQELLWDRSWNNSNRPVIWEYTED